MNNLIKIRKKNNLSQKEFASIFGVAQNTVSNWEKGKRDIDNEKLKAISEYFKVSIDYILNRNTESIIDEETIKRVLLGEKIEEKAWEDLKDYVEFLKSKYGEA